jgi:diguanylate cyclase (GGDEF)-like protein
MSLLKHAYTLIENAEKRVEEQEERISRLESLLSIDPMTSLLNRRGFESFFEREIARAKRHDTKGGLLILFDLDRFKAVNDTFGHLAGDECLKIMATKLRQMIRNVDAAARLGGDEFAVILTDTDEKGGLYKCQKLQKNLDSISFKWNEHAIEFGATLGHSFFNGESQIKSVFDDADKTLYANKTLRKSKR